MAFRPAPPPGTPSLIVDPITHVHYVCIDAVVLDSVAQVVFMASIEVPESADSVVIYPDWPVDSVIVFASFDSDFPESAGLLSFDSPAVFQSKSGTMAIRITFEVGILRALTGPPGPWTYGRVFAIYPAFIGSSGRPIAPDAARIRLMLPPGMEPHGCSVDIVSGPLTEGFKLWELSTPESATASCLFRIEE